MAYTNRIGPTVQFQSGFNSMASGATQGAAMGASIGGPWGALIGGIAGTVAGAFSAILGNDSAEEAARAQLRAAAVANEKNLQELARQISEINRERAIEYRRTQSALTYVETAGTSEEAKARNTYAAADQIGTAVTYAVSNTQMQEDSMKWQEMFNLETSIENTNARVNSLVKTAEGSFYSVDIQSADTDWIGILTGAAALGASAYKTGMFSSSKTNSAAKNFVDKYAVSAGKQTGPATSTGNYGAPMSKIPSNGSFSSYMGL